MTVWVAIGTRPEAIKMAPVVRGLREAGVRTVVCATGQHPALTAGAVLAFGLAIDEQLPPVPPHTPLVGVMAHVVATFGTALAPRPPDLVLVHGDTTGTVAAALAASYARVPVGHVEAGLRTGDPRAPFPEELNRRLVDQLASWWFAPTALARDHLLREGHDPARIFVTGNPVVDALHTMRAEVADRPLDTFPELPHLSADRPVVLVTAHRRENHGEALERICAAVTTLAADGAQIVWPVHPNPDVERVVRPALRERAGVSMTGALSYPAFVRLLLRASLVLTDSGGVQEEAACLGRPTLILRDKTERPEVFATGVVALVGTETARIVDAGRAWLADPPLATGADPLGDGRAGERIGAIVAASLAR